MKLFTLILVLTITLHSFQDSKAQNMQKTSPAVLNHIAVYVTNLEKSTDFYKNTFELNQIPEPFHDGRHTWFSLGAAGQLHLIQGAKGKGNFDKNEHLCFSVAAIDPFIEKLNASHIPYEDWGGAAHRITLRVDGIKQIYFQDPDGHWLEVNDDHK
ncbi:glyoxalase [Pedobacter sp. PACM 27299]|uniref:VOC family protein n=1 Tax=Pedobacter sp. PACM 27299 TaxID=1727164 RepID=UPI000706A1C3|nr:VOC family protein [Pedobacter sp. PACM 27299]ALL07794.1 glyoxalase [Pedobacter sp. PACM 27299]